MSPFFACGLHSCLFAVMCESAVQKVLKLCAYIVRPSGEFKEVDRVPLPVNYSMHVWTMYG